MTEYLDDPVPADECPGCGHDLTPDGVCVPCAREAYEEDAWRDWRLG